VLASDPTTAFDRSSDHRTIRSETTVVKSLGHRVTMLDRVECGFSELVVPLEPEGSAGCFALTTAPAGISQGEALTIAHAPKLACLDTLSRHHVKSYLQI
jgi:hypothetical protein